MTTPGKLELLRFRTFECGKTGESLSLGSWMYGSDVVELQTETLESEMNYRYTCT